LGQTVEIEALEVRWPSGLVQRFDRPPVNRTIAIEEGSGLWRDVYQKIVPANGRGDSAILGTASGSSIPADVDLVR
jgi:hypothetical protein